MIMQTVKEEIQLVSKKSGGAEPQNGEKHI